MAGPFGAWAGPRDARIVFVGEAWGREEAAVGGQPFAGAAGQELWRMLGEAWPDCAPAAHRSASALHRFGMAWVRSRNPWLVAASVAFTNVFNFRPTDNRLDEICAKKSRVGPIAGALPPIKHGQYVKYEYLPELDRLFEELRLCQPNLVVALGNTACWALLRATNISAIRGTICQVHEEVAARTGRPLKVLPTFHPAGLLYEGQWSRRPILVADLMKAHREGAFPEIRRPSRRLLISPSLSEIEAWLAECTARPPTYLACDTETSLGVIDTISFARSARDGWSCQVGPHRKKRGENYETVWPIRDGQKRIRYWAKDEELQFWRLVGRHLELPVPKLFQNGMYDLQYLLRMGFRVDFSAGTEDSMLLHHSLFPEMQKGLGFLGSIYTSEPAWKLMRTKADTIKRDE